VIPDSQITF